MIIHGLQKTTLLDYPTKVAATVFFGGCNFRCPFCHNMNLVLHPEEEISLTEDEVLSFLRSRKGILDGVCITGGEPTLQRDLPAFIEKIKALDFAVKLDTNGTDPVMLKSLVEQSLLDYVAMDIKTSPDHYREVCGTDPKIDAVKESVSFLLSDPIAYEFRTTVISEYHTDAVMEEIGSWIRGAKAYYLQSYKDSPFVPDHSLHACDKDTLLRFAKIAESYVRSVSLRGVD
ncbi:MAG: anaerobic ribonucleoside-triphosphate reductase activating protein [Lachnospiraceae bacterium]|nr:anaerobic ribonucleoside-triphosphate reductase activating protein [Lachnospiraceae bacterium]